jgi:hypothetical protein
MLFIRGPPQVRDTQNTAYNSLSLSTLVEIVSRRFFVYHFLSNFLFSTFLT